jgi:predicted nucleic acid-binding protein
MATVIDASIVLSALLSEEYAARAEEILCQDLICAPRLLALEVTNGLASAVRRKRLGAAEGKAIAEAFESLPVSFDDQPVQAPELFQFAQTHSLTTYDATYVLLAQRIDAKLASFDKALCEVGRRLGVPVLSL